MDESEDRTGLLAAYQHLREQNGGKQPTVKQLSEVTGLNAKETKELMVELKELEAIVENEKHPQKKLRKSKREEKPDPSEPAQSTMPPVDPQAKELPSEPTLPADPRGPAVELSSESTQPSMPRDLPEGGPAESTNEGVAQPSLGPAPPTNPTQPLLSTAAGCRQSTDLVGQDGDTTVPDLASELFGLR